MEKVNGTARKMMHRKMNRGARMVGDFAGKAEEGMEVYESF